MRKLVPAVLIAASLAACGQSAKLHQDAKTVQSNQQIVRSERTVEQQVARCLPTKAIGGQREPDPMVLRSPAQLAKFKRCTGVVQRRGAFYRCLTGGLGQLRHVPNRQTVVKDLTACAEKSA